MDKQLIKRNRQPKKTVLLNIRITKEISQWLRENDYSPTGIFYAALLELDCPHVPKETKKKK